MEREGESTSVRSFVRGVGVYVSNGRAEAFQCLAIYVGVREGDWGFEVSRDVRMRWCVSHPKRGSVRGR